MDMKNVKLPKRPMFVYSLTLVVQWPFCYRYNDNDYYRTGKEGTNIVNGCPSAEYRRDDKDIRLWLDLDGTVKPD